ncbi:MAG: hypothetical protein HY741_03260 [Chloroflexi bacterium]|nr:hypothetical protein [Chloroflexota bacterium]
MRIKCVLLILVVLVGVLVAGCDLAKNVTGQNAGTVANLWSDVPALDGATKVNLDLPLPVQLIIQGFIQAANNDSSSDTRLDKFDFIAYQSALTPQQVAEFYTLEKMQAAGWNSSDTPGCTAGTGDTSGSAGFCVFGKTGDGGKQTVLLILPVQDDQTKQTQVFYIRFEGTKKTQ